MAGTPNPGEDVVINDKNTRDCYYSEGFTRFQYTVDDLLLAASTASTVFNVMVIFCAVKLFKRSGDTMHLFIINMTLGDLILTVFCHPNEFLTRKHEFLRHVHLCAVIHFCNWLGLAISGLSLTLLNVDKLIYFRWPLSYEQTMSKERAAVLCFFIWSVSFGFVSYVWVFQIVYVTDDCMLHMTDERKYYYEIFMIVFCVLPITSSLFVSIYLFRLTRQKRSAPVMIDGSQVDMPTFKNKIVNPLITAIIYAPYRITLKRLLINFPIGNRLQYSHRTEHTETSFLSSARHNQIQQRSRRQRSCNEQEMAELGVSSNRSSSTNKGSTASGPIRRVRLMTLSDESGDLIGNGHMHGEEGSIEEDEGSAGTVSAQSQPAPNQEANRSRSKRHKSGILSASGSAEI